MFLDCNPETGMIYSECGMLPMPGYTQYFDCDLCECVAVAVSSSSSNCSSSMDSSLVSVLDSNPDLPNLYYGEDATNGIIIVSNSPVELRYKALGSNGLPVSTNIFIGGEPVATVDFSPSYAETQFAIVHMGELYCFTLTEQDLYL